MENIRDIFVFDVDGTLMKPSDNRIDQEAIIALNTASYYGDVILASARPLKGIENLYSTNEIKIDNIIALNGGLIVTNSNVTKQFPIQATVVKYFIENSCSFKNLWFYSTDRWFSNNLTSSEYFVERNAVSFDAIYLGDFNQEPVLKITLVSKIDIEVLKSISIDLEVTFSNESYIEIQSKKTNKFLAIENLYEYSKVRIFSFGDSNNDIELLKNSFFSCAVANATAQAKKVSKYVSTLKYGKGLLDSVNFVTQNVLNC